MSDASKDHPLVVYGQGNVGTPGPWPGDAQWICLTTAPKGMRWAAKTHSVDLLAIRLREILPDLLCQHLAAALMAPDPERHVAADGSRPRGRPRKESTP